MTTEGQRARMLNSLKQYQLGKAKNLVAKKFQEMIRVEHAAAHGGVLRCCTCDATGCLGENKFDAGHFIGGRRASVIFNEMNCHVQCVQCNKWGHGMPEAYARFMRKTYGPDAIVQLNQFSREDRKFTHDELCDLKIGFLARIKAAKKKLEALP